MNPETKNDPYYIQTFTSSMEKNGKEKLTSFPQDSPVSHSHVQGSKKARKIPVSFGMKYDELSQRQDPVGLLVRMLLEASKWHSTRCVLTWKLSATPLKRYVFQLAVSMPRTKENGSGLLHTPRANETYEDPEKFQTRMKKYRNGAKMPNLTTPTESDYYNRGVSEKWEGNDLVSISVRLDEPVFEVSPFVKRLSTCDGVERVLRISGQQN